MDPIQVRMPKELRRRLDEEVGRGIYSNRSEAIRSAVRNLIVRGGSNE